MKSSSGPPEAHRAIAAPPPPEQEDKGKKIDRHHPSPVFYLRFLSLISVSGFSSFSFSVPPAAPPYLLITDAGFLISFSHIA
jgi:hypothetical protein